MAVYLYPASFDPITKGHTHIVRRLLKHAISDNILILVSNNPDKKYFLPIDIRKKLVEETFKGFKNIECFTYNGLTVDFAKKKKINFLVRGIRNAKDLEYEMQLSKFNKDMYDKLETIFLLPDSEYIFISSSFVKQLFFFNKDISKYVPKCVFKYLNSM